MLTALACLWAEASGPRNSTFEAYVREHYTEALRQMERYRIPASIKMAQGLVETGAGKSTLARDHNNHFGIKCHRSWQGKRTYKTDDLPDECFRSYRSWQESYEDHSKFLQGARYRHLYSLRGDDYQGWAKGLQQAGYATNKGYANKLIKIIEDYELYALDQGKLPSWMKSRGKEARDRRARQSAERERRRGKSGYTPRPRTPYLSYDLLYIIADAGDSFESIARDMDMSAKKLAKYNDAPIDYPLQRGDIIYLQRKHSKAPDRYSTHVVQVGDSMHSIAQRYGIKLKSLYKLNDKDEEYLPIEGEVLQLR